MSVDVRDWRDAIRDSDLGSTDKLIAHTIATYMNGGGVAFPSKRTIAAGASLKSPRAVYGSVLRLEAAGFLKVSRSRGRTSNGYQAVIPNDAWGSTVNRARGSTVAGSNGASDDTQPGPPVPTKAPEGENLYRDPPRALKARRVTVNPETFAAYD